MKANRSSRRVPGDSALQPAGEKLGPVNGEGIAGGPPYRWLMAPILAGFVWWATELRPFTAPAFWVTLSAGVGTIALGWRARPGAPATAPGPEPRSGYLVWALLAAALAGWELVAFLQLPRAEHPTLSSLANAIFGSHAVRFMAFALWLAAGFGIARR